MIHQLLQGIENRYTQVQRTLADGRDARQADAAPEHRTRREQTPASFAQQVVAPGDRRAQSSLPVRRVRPPPTSSPSESSSRATIVSSGSTLTRAAASSIASGSPSSRSHDSRDRLSVLVHDGEPGTRAAARTANSCADSDAATERAEAPVPAPACAR